MAIDAGQKLGRIYPVSLVDEPVQVKTARAGCRSKGLDIGFGSSGLPEERRERLRGHLEDRLDVFSTGEMDVGWCPAHYPDE
ncbi:hypothetical protein FKM82_020149 [Ascaphus truei]